ncbi:MAG: hypothetical protein F7C08_02905 [Desulfurococcales archaeon]|nr:hypothetical protein [Desulfurococcales archaeon]MCE4605464.1 hypothetical protein [Desulfurococcales archaeon]
MACTGPRMMACIGIAGAGLPALASLLHGPPSLALAAGLLALTLPALGGQAWLVASLLPVLPATAAVVAPGLAQPLAALTVVGQASYTMARTRRLHSLAMLTVLAPVAVGGVEQSLAAVLTTTLGMVASTRVVEESGCPFKSENRLVQAGALISGTGLLASIVAGWDVYVATLWLLGLLLLEAGVLAPRGP